ncbi:MAG: DNA-binding transcriptional LysR family regulator [Gammaproteobacteria bacterium]
MLGLLRAHEAEPEIAWRVKSFELHRSLVANGFGIASTHTLPETKVSYDGMPICAIPITDSLVEQRVLMTCLAQNKNRPVIKSILGEVATLFTDNRESTN